MYVFLFGLRYFTKKMMAKNLYFFFSKYFLLHCLHTFCPYLSFFIHKAKELAQKILSVSSLTDSWKKTVPVFKSVQQTETPIKIPPKESQVFPLSCRLQARNYFVMSAEQDQPVN